MRSGSDSQLVRLLCRVNDVLLSAYPSEFRQHYAGEMRGAFRDQVRDAMRDGTWALVPFLLRTSVDWMHSVVRERNAAVNERDQQMQAARIASLQTMTPPSSLWTAVVVVPVALILAGVGVMEVQDLIGESSHWTDVWGGDIATILRAGIVAVGASFAILVLLILWLARPHHWEVLKKWRWTRWLMFPLIAGIWFGVYLPMIGRRETRALEYVSLPLVVLIPQIMKRIGSIAFGGVIFMAVGVYGHEWWLIGLGFGVTVGGFVYPLRKPQPITSVFGRRLAYVVLIAVLIGVWLLAGYSGVFITQSVARVVHHAS